MRAMNHSLGTLLAQKNDEGFKHAIYYLRRTLIGAESHYNSVEKECLALVFAVQRQTLLGWPNHTCHFESQSPTILMTKPGSLNFRLANWAILLSQ